MGQGQIKLNEVTQTWKDKCHMLFLNGGSQLQVSRCMYIACSYCINNGTIARIGGLGSKVERGTGMQVTLWGKWGRGLFMDGCRTEYRKRGKWVNNKDA